MRRALNEFAGAHLITPKRFSDGRGWFCETYNRRRMGEFKIEATFIQDNESLSRDRGTIRGLHFQCAPMAQGKLVRVTQGAILDVAVDVRRSSATFGDYLAEPLSAEEGQQIWLPPGFAHGFCSLSEDTLISYKVTEFYAPEEDRSLLWNDPALEIAWPDTADPETLSEKDAAAPTLDELAAAGDLFA